MPFPDALAPRRLTLLLVGLLVLYVLAWTLAPGLVNTAVPLDVAESGTWGRELIVMSYKHPNMPGLLIEAAYRLTGQYGWPQYLVSALFAAAGIGLTYLLGRDLLGSSRALVGALLLFGTWYYSLPLPEFNHNIAQLPVWAAIALLVWRAVARHGWIDWLLLGLVAGIGLYAKLSVLVIIGAGGVWLLLDPLARSRLLSLRPWLGMAVFIAFGVLMVALVLKDGGSPLGFIHDSGQIGGHGPLEFLGAQILDVVLVLPVLALLFWRRKGRGDDVAEPLPDAPGLARARFYLLLMTGLPFAVILIVAAINKVHPMWATPMLNLTGLLLVALLPGRIGTRAVRIALASGLVFTLLFPVFYVVRHYVTQATASQPLRTQWPQQQISARFRQIWLEKTGQPLRLVGGDYWLDGLVALAAEPRPHVFSYLDHFHSPWIAPDQVARDGMLVLWRGAPDDTLAAVIAGHDTGTESFIWSSAPSAEPIAINYAIIPPGTPAATN